MMNYDVMFPRNVKDLNCLESLVLAGIYSYGNKFYARLKVLGERLDLDESEICTNFNSLLDKGYLKKNIDDKGQYIKIEPESNRILIEKELFNSSLSPEELGALILFISNSEDNRISSDMIYLSNLLKVDIIRVAEILSKLEKEGLLVFNNNSILINHIRDEKVNDDKDIEVLEIINNIQEELKKLYEKFK